MPDSYAVTATLYESATVSLHRAVRQKDNGPVIIKTIHIDRATPREVERLRHEYEVMQQLDGPYLLKPIALTLLRTQARLIMEDFDGEPLSSRLFRPLDTRAFLDISTRLAAAVADIHRQDIVHKDLKPENILRHRDTGAIKLTGLGIAVRLAHAATAQTVATFIEGSLAYMSPEQTGRMNRGVDHRSDLYSLGVVFHQLLSGELPFQATDPLEWAHCHIARQPESLADIVPAVSGILAAIVLKLLAKQAEERYQSAHGLRLDLERCRDMLAASDAIASFPLGQHDASDRLLISPKLYGRETERLLLLESLEQVTATGRARLALVSGHPGIGKSALVRELLRPVARTRGYFAAGKCDRYQRDIPYATIATALQDLLQQILADTDARVQTCKAELEKALGANARLIVHLIPELELIVGRQPPAPELPPTEAKRRFRTAIRGFVAVFAQREHPLVLFLDDLQWADLASLKLVTDLATNADPYALLLVGTYRDNEVTPSHPLMHAINELRQSDVVLQELVLGPLSPADLQQWLTDTFHRRPSEVASLARLLFEKTAGNPFFVIQFLTTLYRDGYLTYHRKHQHWRWESEAIREQEFTDNVVEMMLDKVKRFSTATQQALMSAACLGNTAEVRSLSLLRNEPEQRLHHDLRAAVDEGLIWRTDGSYRFLHDRVREAAYALLPEDERPAQHLQIARLMLAHTPADHLGANIFEIVGHFNRGADLITSPDERARVAELNRSAGLRAKSAAAYSSAIGYYAAAAALLGPDAWGTRHDTAFAVHLEHAQCAVLTGAFDAAEQLVSLLLKHVDTRFEEASIHRVLIDIDSIRGKGGQAIKLILTSLRLFGIDMPDHPTVDQVQSAFQAVWHNLGDREVEDLLDLPAMEDSEIKAAMELLARLYIPAYYSDHNLLHLHLAHAVTLSIRHGNAPASVQAYGWFGLVLAVAFHRYQEGYRFAKLAFDLMERHQFLEYKAKAIMQMRLISLWTQSYDTALEYTRLGFEAGREAGDVTTACMCSYDLVVSALARGAPLSEVTRQAEQGFDFVRKTGFRDIYDMIASVDWFAQTLRGSARYLSTYDENSCTEAAFEAAIERGRMPSLVCYYYTPKLMTRFLFGDYEAALAAGDRIKPLLWTGRFSVQYYFFHFYYALTLVALFETLASERKQEARAALATHAAQLHEWAESYPPTFLSPWALVSAEIARLDGRHDEAMRLYEQAIESARENAFVQNEALAYELAAQFYKKRGLKTIARFNLREARRCYIRWGADAKVHQIDQHNPHLIETKPTTSTAAFAADPEQLDSLAVIKASHAISREILPAKLQETLVRLALEQAAAQRGLLLVAEGDGLTIHAKVEMVDDRTHVEILPSLQISAATMPLSLLNNVRRTGETIALEDAARKGHYVDDEYIRQHRPRSVLGLPIVRQRQVVGVLYLENNLAAGAFTPSRLAALELLAAQAAISLETARLYATLQHENAERRRAEEEVRTLNRELEQRVLERTVELEAANKELEAFSYSVSHDLRAPVRHISGFLERLQTRTVGILDERSQHYIATIFNATKRMDQLIEDLLSFSRTGRHDLTQSSIDLGALVEEIIDELAPDVQGRPVSWQVTGLPTVVGDGALLRVALANLIGNALKFTRPRELAAIEIGSHPSQGSEVVIFVRDNGVGFDPELADKLFGVFARLHRADEFEGSGIGLAIVHRIVSRHGGRVWAEGEIGRGATFYFSLPQTKQVAK